MKCPHCGKSHYRELYGTSTCLGWSPEYKDGKLVNHDPNILTMNYECCECGARFHTSNNGEPVLDSSDKNYSEILDMPTPEDLVGDDKSVIIDSDGVVHGMENVNQMPGLNRYRRCNICGKDFICGSSVSTGIGPDADKYICDECAEGLRKLLYGDKDECRTR